MFPKYHPTDIVLVPTAAGLECGVVLKTITTETVGGDTERHHIVIRPWFSPATNGFDADGVQSMHTPAALMELDYHARHLLASHPAYEWCRGKAEQLLKQSRDAMLREVNEELARDEQATTATANA